MPEDVVTTSHRKINFDDQTVSCVECQFIAPLSISFEEFQRLHDKYLKLSGRVCSKRHIIVTKSPSDIDKTA